MAVHQFEKQIFIPASIGEVWDFISNPANLKVITPKSMGFQILGSVPQEMFAGLEIRYRVRPLFGIPVTWVTLISEVDHHKSFTDEQKKGPFKSWKHEHLVEAVDGGVKMHDRVQYEPPFGVLGEALNGPLIQKKLNQIFEFRERAIMETFPKD